MFHQFLAYSLIFFAGYLYNGSLLWGLVYIMLLPGWVFFWGFLFALVWVLFGV